jgi:hypothetical protein
MKLTTVLASVNDNKEYYLFIPKQIEFWKRFGIKFIAIFVGHVVPDELQLYNDNIILWDKNLNLKSAYIAQNIRIYYPALINLPEDELLMITDMDMLPMNDTYYKNGLEAFTKDDFIYYRHIDGNQIYMCYNAAHPSTWSKVFEIYTTLDIENKLNSFYNDTYDGRPGSTGWYTDQLIMFKYLAPYPHLKVLNRPLKRLEMNMYDHHLNNKDTNFIHQYDDAHFHRSYFNNEILILHAESQLPI